MGHLLQQVSFFMFNIPQSVQSFKCFLLAAVSGGTGSACRPAFDLCPGIGGNRCQGLSLLIHVPGGQLSPMG